MVLGCYAFLQRSVVLSILLVILVLGYGWTRPLYAQATDRLDVSVSVLPNPDDLGEGTWALREMGVGWQGAVADWIFAVDGLIQAGEGEQKEQELWRGELSVHNATSGSGGVGLRLFHGKSHFASGDLLKLVESDRYRDDGSGVVAFIKTGTAQLTGAFVDSVANIGDDGRLLLLEGHVDRGKLEFLADVAAVRAQPVLHTPASGAYTTSTDQVLASLQLSYLCTAVPLTMDAQVAGTYTDRQTRTFRYRGGDGAGALRLGYNSRSRTARVGGTMQLVTGTDGFRSVLGSAIKEPDSWGAVDVRTYWRPSENLRLQGQISLDGPLSELGAEVWQRFARGDVRVGFNDEEIRVTGRARLEKSVVAQLSTSLQYRPESNYWRVKLDVKDRNSSTWKLDHARDENARRIAIGMALGWTRWQAVWKWSALYDPVFLLRCECPLRSGSISASYGYDDRGRIEVGWTQTPRIELSYRLKL